MILGRSSSSDRIGGGLLTGCILHMSAIPFVFLISVPLQGILPEVVNFIFRHGSVLIANFGVTQLFYMVPFYLVAKGQGCSRGFRKGLRMAGMALFLLNGTMMILSLLPALK